MPELTIELHITAGQMLAFYRGQSRTVQAQATNGQIVRFPAVALQRHITKDGIHGTFRLQFDDSHKFVGLHPVT